MNRKYLRLVGVVTVMLVTGLTVLPAAEARELSGSRFAVTSTTEVMSAALGWMADLLGLGHKGLSHQASMSIGGPGGGYHTNTGPCIDPNGGGAIDCSAPGK